MYQAQESSNSNPFYNDFSIIKTEPITLSYPQQQQLLLTESFQPSCIKQQEVFFLDDFEYLLYNPVLDMSTIMNSDYTGIMEYSDFSTTTTSSPSSITSLLDNDFFSPPPSPPYIEQPLQQQQQQVCTSTSKTKPSPCQHKKNHQQSTMIIPLQSQQQQQQQQKKNKTFTCHICSRQFARKHDLQRHIRVHTGVKPYSCLNCSKSFVRTDALKRHLRLDENCKKSPIIQALAKSGNRRYQNL